MLQYTSLQTQFFFSFICFWFSQYAVPFYTDHWLWSLSIIQWHFSYNSLTRKVKSKKFTDSNIVCLEHIWDNSKDTLKYGVYTYFHSWITNWQHLMYYCMGEYQNYSLLYGSWYFGESLGSHEVHLAQHRKIVKEDRIYVSKWAEHMQNEQYKTLWKGSRYHCMQWCIHHACCVCSAYL